MYVVFVICIVDLKSTVELVFYVCCFCYMYSRFEKLCRACVLCMLWYVSTLNKTLFITEQTGHHMKYSVILLCSAHLLMDGSVSDDPVFSHNEKYITDWICRWLICPLLCQLAINLETLPSLPEIFMTKILQKKFAVDTYRHSHRPWIMIVVCYDFFYPSTDNTKIWHSSLVVFIVVSRGIKKNLNKPLWWTYNIS